MITKSEISLVRSLADKKAREEHGLFVVEGPKMVGEALDSGLAVKRVYGTGEYAGIPRCEIVSGKDIERMSSLRTPQGVLALVEMPVYDMPGNIGGELSLALDGVRDPGNMGTIIRIADWFGIKDIICSPDSADCFNPKVVQATMGAVLRVRVHYAGLAELLGKAGCPLYGTFLEGDNIYGADLGNAGTGVIVMGNEGSGISVPVAGTITRKLYIPPYPAGRPCSESLNVATATAVVCSEFRRRLSDTKSR